MAAPKSGPTAKIILNEEQIEMLVGMGCTMTEIAAFFKCHVDTLRDNYSNALERGLLIGKASVRRMMWDHGKKGNSTALKYLVHNILKEKIEESPFATLTTASSEAARQIAETTPTETLLQIVRDYDKTRAG